MTRGYRADRSRTSSALVITLLCIVLLTIITVSFLQTMSLALTTAKSYSDLERATLAAQAGLDTAVDQITVATGTNLAFVTGQTNYPFVSTINYPVTVIGKGNLTNLDQMMPLVSGQISLLSAFGNTGFAANFASYALPRTNSNARIGVDVNSAYKLGTTNSAIQLMADTSTANSALYRASWVVMTNVVGNLTNYTRYAYVVLDDCARVNPTLMTGAGAGFSDPSNWYSGPQDINPGYLTNYNGSANVQSMTAAQLTQVTNASSSFGYSDASLAEAYPSSLGYQLVKHYFTAQANPSFDVIPAWMANGGLPKYNLNDLATNTAYGTDANSRASNIASIIGNNLPLFYKRDVALRTTNTTAYVQRLAAAMVDYCSPSTSQTSINGVGSGDEPAVFPTLITEQLWASAADGSVWVPPATTVLANARFWVSVWNPYTKPIQITSAHLNIANRAPFTFGSTTSNSVEYVEDMNTNTGTGGIVRPNEMVVLGFIPQSFLMTSSSSQTAVGSGGSAVGMLDQYQLFINGQIVAQSQGPFPAVGQGANTGGGFDDSGLTFNSTNRWKQAYMPYAGNEVGDPRFNSFYHTEWGETHDNSPSDYYIASRWRGYPGPATPGSGAGHRSWDPHSMWTYRDYVQSDPSLGSTPTTDLVTPDTTVAAYNVTNSASAPEVVRNGPMVSIGELGHVYDPVYAADDQSGVNDWGYNASGAGEAWGMTNVFQAGGGRSLRIGRPDAPPSVVTVFSTNNWNVDGERAQALLDIFTVNSTNLSTGGSLGRINPNTASTNVLVALLSGIRIDAATNSSLIIPGYTPGNYGGAATLTNIPGLAAQVVANRPYSTLSDLYKVMPLLGAATNYSPKWPTDANNLAPAVPNRVHQEAFGKLIQHLTVQSRSYRVYVVGQVLDNSQNPRGSIVMEAGIYLTIDPTFTRYEPVIQYVRVLK